MYWHPNLAPFIGFCYEGMLGLARVPCLITPFYENGSIMEYIRKKDIKPQDAVRMKLLYDVLNGLNELHDQGIVHGNLKPTNILIDYQGNAVLVEFGLTPMPWTLRERHSKWDSDCYLAPELLSITPTPTPTPTFSSDVWATGMVGLQILSENISDVEYENLNIGPWLVIDALLAEKKPEKAHYPHVPEGAWSAFLLCWAMEPITRPTVATLKDLDLARSEDIMMYLFWLVEFQSL
ncbi:kinase-like domain-containing protein [Suillus clintonianus]|uniref:kinase-like domain-containing protein n=1 Tax=Suillus clintonianus TaxID=1904413 RepID=UPI001B868E45|nr:kinase-like domain-containing protein [Suillus clintonianus]KAG2122902.1 kinase-like domain-containing protein [Suillus clintonianus]